MKKNEMGMTCGMYGRGKGFWWGNLSERERLEDVGVSGRIILK